MYINMHPLTSIECIFKNATQLQHSGSVPFLGFGKQMMHHSQSQTMETRESPSLGILDRIVCLHNDNSTTWYHQRQISNISSLRPMKTSMFNACVWIDHILFLQPVVASSPSFVPTRT